MQALELLPPQKRALLEEIVAALAQIPGVAAVVLGGSYARGTAMPESDVDLGLYYAADAPFRLDDVRAVAARFDLGGAPAVTDFYEWGPWVNGGSWLETTAGRVDFTFREIGHVERVIAAAQRGEIEWHYGQQPPYGFRSIIYLAESASCRPLHDPRGVIARLKQASAIYPEPLRSAILRASLWSAEFTLFHLRKFAAQGDAYNASGCLTRAACELVQVVFALNRCYFGGDKGALAAASAFRIAPRHFGARLESILSAPGASATALTESAKRLAELIADTIAIAGDLYAAKYRLPR